MKDKYSIPKFFKIKENNMFNMYKYLWYLNYSEFAHTYSILNAYHKRDGICSQETSIKEFKFLYSQLNYGAFRK